MMSLSSLQPACALAVFALLALGCAGQSRAKETQALSPLEAALAEDDDLGNPRSAPEELDDEQKAALLNDPDATQMNFDGDEANDSPTDIITTPGDRKPMPSMMKDIVLAPQLSRG